MNVHEEIYSIPQLPSADWMPVAPRPKQGASPGVPPQPTVERAIGLVRGALLAPHYRIEMESVRDEFWSCLRSRPPSEAGTAAPREEVMMTRLRGRFGAEWASGFASARALALATRAVMREDLGQARPPDRYATADRRALESIRTACVAYDWACLAVQIMAAEGIAVSDEVQALLEDDLTYRPRELYLAVCACRFHRGGARHGWLDEVYTLAAEGHARTALGLLFDGVRDVIGPGGRPAEFFACLDWTRLTPGLVRGVLTATGTVPNLDGRAAFEREAATFLGRAYSRSEPRGG